MSATALHHPGPPDRSALVRPAAPGLAASIASVKLEVLREAAILFPRAKRDARAVERVGHKEHGPVVRHWNDPDQFEVAWVLEIAEDSLSKRGRIHPKVF